MVEIVILAKAGIQDKASSKRLDSSLRWNDRRYYIALPVFFPAFLL